MARFLTLDIGAEKATLAEYAQKGKSLTLVQYGDVALGDASADALGSLAATLGPALRALMREKGMHPAPVLLSLSGQMVFPRFAKFPAVSEDKLEQMVQYEVEQNVPFPVDEIVCDHQFLGVTPEGERAAVIVAAKIDQVREATDAIRAAGLTPQLVDVAPMALFNALKASQGNLEGCTVLLDIGSKTTNLILVENEKIYNRSIPVAGNTITREIATSFGCSLEEAEELKRTRGYVSLGGVTEDEDEVADRISKIVRNVFTRLHAEISRSINFYRSQQGGGEPKRLFLTGGSVRLAQVDAFFSETLQLDVEFLNPFGVTSFGPKIDAAALESDAFSLAVTAGLAARMNETAEVSIDLLPPELAARARALKRIPCLVAGAVCILVALGLAIFAEGNLKAVAEAQTEAVTARNNALKSLESKLKAEQEAERAEFESNDAFQQLLAARTSVLARVDAVRKSLLAGMWITAWEEKDDGADITIRGWSDQLTAAEAKYSAENGGRKSTSAEIVVANLKVCPLVAAEGVKITASKDVRGCITEFTIHATYVAPPSFVQDETGAKKKGKARK